MPTEEIVNGLKQLGFNNGWVLNGEEIVIWENPQPKPTIKAILEAAKDYVAPEPTIEEKLASVGVSLDDLKTALGL